MVDIKSIKDRKYRSLSPDSYRDGEGDGACLPAGRGEAGKAIRTQPKLFENANNNQLFRKW